MRQIASFFAALVLVTSLSACATVSPYGQAAAPTPEAQAYAGELLQKPPQALTEDEREFLLLYAQQAEAHNQQARTRFEQTVFVASTGLSVLSAVVFLIDRL